MNNPKKRKSLNLDEKLMLAAESIETEGGEITFEKLVAVCFQMYPDDYSLRGYKHWPGSARVNKSWLRCRTDFHYLEGSLRNGFRITSNGHAVLRKMKSSALNNTLKSTSSSGTRARNREHMFVSRVKQSDLYKHFISTESLESLNYFEVCELLQCGHDSTPKELLVNLETLLRYSSNAEDKPVTAFLNTLRRAIMKRQLESPISDKSSKNKKGGTMKAKLA